MCDINKLINFLPVGRKEWSVASQWCDSKKQDWVLFCTLGHKHLTNILPVKSVVHAQ